jgi:hypothetical protein
MRALLTSFCAVGMVAAVTATAWAGEHRSHRTTGPTFGAGSSDTNVAPSGGTPYDASGAPYSSHQYNYDSSNDFQLQGHGLNDADNARDPKAKPDKGNTK